MAMHSERKRLTAIDYTDSVTWTTKKRPASAIKWPCTQKCLQKVHMSPLKGKDFNTTAIDYRFSDLDYKLLKRDYKKRPQKSVQQAAINWSCTQKHLQKVQGSQLDGKDFNTTAIDYRFSDLDYKLMKRDYKRGHRKAFSKAAINWSCTQKHLQKVQGSQLDGMHSTEQQ